MSNQPVPPKTAESDDAVAAKADLSHFRRAASAENEVPLKKSQVDISESLSGAFSKMVLTGTQIKRVAGASKRYVLIGVLLALVVPVLVLVGINIPLQVARSEAFSLYQKGDYETSLLKFRSYLKDRPSDTDAVFHAAQAAIHIEDYDYANTLLGKLAHVANIANRPDYMFAYALALMPSAEAMPVLNNLVANAPDHTGGRLLRGVLLANQNQLSRAREDFLQADSVIRGANYDNTDMLSAHRRVVENAATILPIFEPPSAITSDAPILQALSRRLGVPVFADMYINRYFLILPEDAEASGISDDNIVSMYYTVMLLRDGQFNEAQVEFSKLSPEVMSESPVGSLQGIAHALMGDYQAAFEVFQSLSEQLDAHPVLFFNLANAVFSANPTAQGAADAVELLSKVLALDENFISARSNRALLRLLLGDNIGAMEDIDAVSATGKLSQAMSNLRVLALLAQDPHSADLDQLLFLQNAQSDDLIYARVARYSALGQYDAALELLRKMMDEESGWSVAARLYADQLANAGLLMRARNVWLARAPQRDAETRYNIGKIELAAGNKTAALALLSAMEKDNTEDAYTYALSALVLGESDVEGARRAIDMALANAQTPQQRQDIAVDLANLLFKIAPEVLRMVLQSPLLPDAATDAVVARLQLSDDSADIARAAVARYPFANVQYHAGIALAESGQIKEAIEVLQAAVQWQPLNIELLEIIVQLYSGIDQTNKAKQTQIAIDNIKLYLSDPEANDNIETFTIDSPPDERLVKYINGAQAKTISPQQAVSRFQQLIEQAESNKDKAVLHFQRATFLLAIEQYALSEKDIRDANTLKLPFDKQKSAAIYLAKALSKQQKHKESLAIYRQLADQFPENPLYRRQTGQAMSNINPQLAIEYLRETIDIFPVDIESYFELVTVYQKNQNDVNDVQNAINVLRRAARVMPFHVPTYGYLSRVQRISNTFAAKENSVVADLLRKQ